MVDKINIGQKTVNFPSSPACGQWETLLADALDGLLRPEDEATFSGHMATCAYCSEMFEQARRGREWLEFLAPEPEVPAYLLEKILVETGHGKLDASKLVVAGGPEAGNVLTMAPAWQRPGFAAGLRRFAEPRLLMTAAMAFFSIALTLSLTGVHFTAIKVSDLRPATLRSALEKRIMTASTPIVRYYDHLRFVYEVESRVRELRKSTETDQQSPDAGPNPTKTQPDGESHQKDGGSRLNPGRNPKEAPQQTVNPPASLWGGDTLQAGLILLPAGQRATQTLLNITTGDTAHPEAPNSDLAASLETGVLAMPDRSLSCLA